MSSGIIERAYLQHSSTVSALCRESPSKAAITFSIAAFSFSFGIEHDHVAPITLPSLLTRPLGGLLAFPFQPW